MKNEKKTQIAPVYLEHGRENSNFEYFTVDVIED